MFLKPCNGLQEWREWAQGNMDSALFAFVSTLPEVKCKVSAGMTALAFPSVFSTAAIAGANDLGPAELPEPQGPVADEPKLR